MKNTGVQSSRETQDFSPYLQIAVLNMISQSKQDQTDAGSQKRRDLFSRFCKWDGQQYAAADKIQDTEEDHLVGNDQPGHRRDQKAYAIKEKTSLQISCSAKSPGKTGDQDKTPADPLLPEESSGRSRPVRVLPVYNKKYHKRNGTGPY